MSPRQRSTTLRASSPRGGSSAHSRNRSANARAGGTANITIDHDEIRRWAEARDGAPAVVKRTRKGGDEEGILRLDFPGFSGAGTLESISWEEWFDIFDNHELAFLYQARTSSGKPSRFNKLIRRSECQ
jgi:hypothetical protein